MMYLKILGLVITALLLTPLLATLWAWKEQWDLRRVHRRIATLLRLALVSALTLSAMWIPASLIYPSLLGEDYTPRRFHTIEMNLLFSLVCMGLVFVTEVERKGSVALSAGLLVMGWGYMLAISSVV